MSQRHMRLTALYCPGGHVAPILWAALSEAGAIDEDPLSLRQIDSTPR